MEDSVSTTVDLFRLLNNLGLRSAQDFFFYNTPKYNVYYYAIRMKNYEDK